MNSDYDILIAGGGMVGASLARSLAGSGLSVAVVEAVGWNAPSGQPGYDDRVIALAWGSRLILESMGLWRAIEPEAEPIRRIHISDRGHFGFARLDHREQGVPALGYVVSARAIGRGLLEGVGEQQRLEWISPARVTDFHVEPERVQTTLEVEGGQRRIGARLLVAADGSNSPIRRRLNLPLQEWSYEHTAVIANLTPGRPHDGVAYERFTDSGPLAMLPMTGGRCSMVWTQRDKAVQEILALDDAAFLQRLQERFGFRLGRLARIGRRTAHPLHLMRVKELVRPRVVLIGNAAHTLHPVSGQGFNLGLRDVAQLAQLLVQAKGECLDPGAAVVLDRYAGRRSGDQRQMALVTDFLARLFINPLPPVRLVRNLGLLAMDLMPLVKRGLARRFMGLR